MAKDVLDSIKLGAVLVEVPVVRWPYLVQELSFLILFFGIFLEELRIFSHEFLLLGDPQVVVVLNKLSDFVRLHPLEALQQDEIFNILDDMGVNILEGLSCIQPFFLVLFVEVAIPDPVSSILCYFFFLLLVEFLGFAHVGMRITLLIKLH